LEGIVVPEAVMPEKVYLILCTSGEMLACRLTKRNDQLIMKRPVYITVQPIPETNKTQMFMSILVGKPEEVPIDRERIFWKYVTEERGVVDLYHQVTGTVKIVDLEDLSKVTPIGGRKQC
jgi:bifunctional pyridoxal-dependent enzyme with beta-cystathionase and maltose regulon repressor activities